MDLTGGNRLRKMENSASEERMEDEHNGGAGPLVPVAEVSQPRFLAGIILSPGIGIAKTPTALVGSSKRKGRPRKLIWLLPGTYLSPRFSEGGTQNSGPSGVSPSKKQAKPRGGEQKIKSSKTDPDVTPLLDRSELGSLASPSKLKKMPGRPRKSKFPLPATRFSARLCNKTNANGLVDAPTPALNVGSSKRKGQPRKFLCYQPETNILPKCDEGGSFASSAVATSGSSSSESLKKQNSNRGRPKKTKCVKEIDSLLRLSTESKFPTSISTPKKRCGRPKKNNPPLPATNFSIRGLKSKLATESDSERACGFLLPKDVAVKKHPGRPTKSPAITSGAGISPNLNETELTSESVIISGFSEAKVVPIIPRRGRPRKDPATITGPGISSKVNKAGCLLHP